MSNTKKEYRLMHGSHFVKDANGDLVSLAPGAVVSLTASEAAKFTNKFQEVGGGDPVSAATIEQERQLVLAGAEQEAGDIVAAAEAKAAEILKAAETQAASAKAAKAAESKAPTKT